MQNLTIFKYTKVNCQSLKERLIVKTFKYNDDMHKFTQRADQGNIWTYWSDNSPFLYDKALPVLKAGTYAYAGGKYHNVKHLDASVLAHI